MLPSFTIGTPPRCFALVPCAGVGERAGQAGPKQYVELQGRAVVVHTLLALAGVPRIDSTLVVLQAEDTHFEPCFPEFAAHRVSVARCGGTSRALSVAAGLQALREHGAAPHDWVLVHDAARCLLRPAWVQRLIDACEGDEVGGLLALPLADTLKLSVDGRVDHTIARVNKWAAQTPQMFRLGLLQGALNQALSNCEIELTDEASAIEQLGHAPLLVPGEIENFKLTWPGDFALAARLLETR